MEERPSIWRVAVNKLNKQSRTADEGWSFSLGLGEVLTTPLRKKRTLKNTHLEMLPLEKNNPEINYSPIQISVWEGVFLEELSSSRKRQMAGTCGYVEGLSSSINARKFLTCCKVNWLASQEGLCSME
jgi:hypothetical protein